MLQALRRRLTYANVVASLALFVALGGVSYAAVKLPKKSVGPAQLKKNAVTKVALGTDAVTSEKVENGSLLARDFKSGQLPAGLPGAQGPKGDPGLKGDAGLAGAVGRPGVSEYERIETIHNVAPGDLGVTIGAQCPPGKKLLGGGGVVQDSKLHITYLFPQANDVFALTAVLLPGQTITGNSQAFVEALCGKVG